jgi:cytochrome c553
MGAYSPVSIATPALLARVEREVLLPTLAGQSEDYLVAALSQYKSGKRQNPIMAPQTANLSQQDMADLAAYFASQQGLKLKY